MRAWLRILWVLAIWVVAFELKAWGAPGQLGAPWVFAPVSTCNESVAVGGVFDGATVTVLLRGSDGRLRAVGEAVASWVTVVIRLDQLPPGGLQQGDQLMAKQKMGTEESAESPKPVEVQEFKVGYLNQLNFWTHPYVCSHCMAFDGLVPGGELEVRPSGSSGKAGALHGFAIARIEPGLGFEEELEVRQSACQQVGPVVAGPVAEPTPLDAHRRLAAPQIAKDMYACENVVPVNKVVEGALVTVSRQVGAVTVPFYSTGQDVKVSEPLKESETVSVMQAMPDCDIVDSPKTTRSVLPASAKPAPWVVGPLCAGSHLVTVGGLSVGSRFRVLQDGVEVSVCRASEEEWPCDVPSLKAEADITAQMELCGNWGPRSQAMPVEELPANIPQPEIAVDPLIACSVIVPVENVQPGAWVTAHSKNLGQISQATYAKGTEIRLKVAPALWAGDQVTVEELACLDTVVRSRTVNVQPAPALGYPQIVTPVCASQSAVRVRNVVPGAQVQLYLNRKFAAAANTGMSDVTIDVGYPLSPNDRLNARQLLCNASTKLDPEREVKVQASPYNAVVPSASPNLSYPKNSDEVINISTATTKRMATEVTRWGVGKTQHVAGIDTNGDLLVFWWDEYITTPSDKLSVKYVNVSQITGYKVAGPVISWLSRQGSDVVEHLSSWSPSGELLYFWWQPNDQKWRVENISVITGQKISGPVTSWTAEQGSYQVRHLAGYSCSSELFDFWWQDDGKGWRVDSITQVTGQQVVGRLTSWTAKQGSNIVQHVAGYAANGDLLDFWRKDDGQGWRLSNISQATGQLLADGPLTSWVSDDGIQHIAGRDVNGQLMVFWWKDDSQGWRFDNLSQITGMKVANSVAAAELYDPYGDDSRGLNKRNLNSIFAVDPAGAMLVFDLEVGTWKVQRFAAITPLFSVNPFTVFYNKPAFLLYGSQQMNHVALIMENGNLVLRRQYIYVP